MPNRISRPRDVSQSAFEVVRHSTSEEAQAERPSEIIIEVPKETKPSKYDISRVMAEMGRRGGQIGGKRRLETMTKAERTKIATKAAKTRWKNAKKSAPH
jgi:hypothetical protein